MKFNILLLALFIWLISLIFTVYSYTQIDLNLTLSSWQPYQLFQQKLIYLGYFNRPLSALIYLVIILSLFIYYLLILDIVDKQKIQINNLYLIIISTCTIFLFSYPAFSHDIYNYIFDARIVIYHHSNPYIYTALSFPDDLWTRFMHWTHRTYPYGPFWLLSSIPFYVLGLGKFVLTLLNFKLFLALSYLGTSYVIYKITKSLSSLVLFAFNPLIIIESLVSPHLDIYMTFLGIWALYLLISQKKTSGYIILTFSVITKYATFGYLPMLLNKLNFNKKIKLMIISTFILVIAQILYREILPWYFIPIIALCSIKKSDLTKKIILALSVGGTLYYIPYLYLGVINPFLINLRIFLFIMPFIIMGFYYFIKNIKH